MMDLMICLFFFIIVCLFSLRNMLESFSWRDWQVGTRIYFKKNDHKKEQGKDHGNDNAH